MIDTNALRKRVLGLAVSGQLSERRSTDSKISSDLKYYHPKYVTLPDIPKEWMYCKFDEVLINRDSERIPVSVVDRKKLAKIYNYYGASGVIDKVDNFLFDEKLLLIGEDGANLISRNTPIAFIADGKYWVNNHAHVIEATEYILLEFAEIAINSMSLVPYITGMAQPKLSQNMMNKIAIPIPPIEEQERIVKKVDDIFSVLDNIDELQCKYFADKEILKSKIIDAGIQGKLTEQLAEDGNAEELYDKIQVEKEKRIKEEKKKKEKVLTKIKENEIPFEIPKNWTWIRLGWVVDIERGGSPRPIKAFITDDEDGINWIKISDVDKGGKYIFGTEEKIKPEGEKKSRKVYPGDFLLTNSMSFGRPYITKVGGCIHDGWLLLRNSNEVYDLNFLYYLLSSTFVYKQFCKKASGSTVENLNKEKVALSIVSLPPLKEQKRIVDKIESFLKILDKR